MASSNQSGSTDLTWDDLGWFDRLVYILARSSGWGFRRAAYGVKAFLAFPFALGVSGLVWTAVETGFGEMALSRAEVWARELFSTDTAQVFPGRAPWLSTVVSFMVLIGTYWVVLRTSEDINRMVTIDPWPMRWRTIIAAWTLAFVLVLGLGLGAVKAVSALRTPGSEGWSPKDVFGKVAPQEQFVFSGDSLRLERTGSVIYHRGGVDSAQARAVGRYLENVEYLREDRSSSALVAGDTTGYEVTLPVSFLNQDHVPIEGMIPTLRKDLSDWLGNHPVTVVLVDHDSSGVRHRRTFPDVAERRR